MAETWHSRSLRDILRVVFSRWISGLLIFAIVLGAAVAVTVYSPRSYQTSVSVRVPFTDVEEKMIGIRSADTWEVLLKTLRETALSDEVLGRTLARFDHPALARPLDAADLAKAGVDPLSATPDAIETAAAAIRTDAPERISEFRKDVRMETPGGQEISKSQVFTLYVRYRTAAGAKKLADLLVEEFRYRYFQKVLAQMTDNVKRAQARLTSVSGPYQQARVDYQKFTDDPASRKYLTLLSSLLNPAPGDVGTAVVDVKVKQDAAMLQADRAQKDAMLQAMERSRDATNAMLESVRRPAESQSLEAMYAALDPARTPPPDDPRFIPHEIRMNNKALDSLVGELADRTAQRIAMLQTKDKGYAPLDELTREIFGLIGQVAGQLQQGIAEVKAGIAQDDARLKELDKLQLTAGLPDNIGTMLTTFRDIKTRLSTYEDQWRKGQNDLNDANALFDAARVQPSILPSEPAPVPDKPDRPIVWLNLAVGAAVGLLLAIAYLFLADFYDHTVRSIDEVERYFGVPVLASVRRMRHPIRR